MIFIDTNVPVYAGGHAHPLQAPCYEVLQRAGTSDRFVTSAEVLQELFHHVRRRWRWADDGDAYRKFAQTMEGAVLPIEEADLAAAVALSAQVPADIEARDLLHAAVMQRHGVRSIATADRDFDRIPGIERLDPLEVARWAPRG